MNVYSADEETKDEAEILNVPELPAAVQGDGRYLMSLLKSFLQESTKQINLANGFTQEEIDDSKEGEVSTPRNFKLTFTRLGGEFTWDHIKAIETLAYYELRTDTNIGNAVGLLDRTIENSSMKLPVTYVGHVYLYAFNKEAKHSNPAEIIYNKPRPDAPTDISIIKNTEGTLITFSEIPSNCIGANIYIGSQKYQAVDNVYLIKGELTNVEQVQVAFYDQFGEGERGTLYLVLPDVTGFLVERNGPELDFYWDALNIYNVKYVVKVCNELSWAKGIELFRTTTNDKNRILYPNRGEYYLMVKAYDEHGNYSKNAAYQLMTTDTDISRNVILEFNQQDVLYNGTKINLFYDPAIEGVTLERGVKRGEYIFDVQLDQKYKARNWLEFSALTVTNDNNLMWQDCNFTWDEAGFQWAGVIGNIDSAKIKQEISYYKGMSTESLFSAQLNGDLKTDKEENPAFVQNADDFRQSRWAKGLFIKPLTKLEYNLNDIRNTYNMVFILVTDKPLDDTIILTLTNPDNEYLTLGFDKRTSCFYLSGSDGKTITLQVSQSSEKEYYTFGISQSLSERTFYLHSLNKDMIYYDTIAAAPVSNLNMLYCYPKL